MAGLGLVRQYGIIVGRPVIAPDSEVCMDSDEVLQPFFLCEPPEQVRLFILLFCSSIALSLVVNHAAAARFYNFFVSSQVTPDQRRGLGYTASHAYGFFPIPRLSMAGFRLVSWLLVATLLLACHTRLAPRFFLFASFGLYFLYFGQLFCESKHGGHGSLLVPSVVMLLALSGGPQGSPWSLVFIKMFLGVVYFSGAVSKVLVAALFGMPWCGSTMQAYVFDAMWSRPHPWSLVRRLQRMLLTRWWLCSVLAASGLIFEFGFLPLVLLGGEAGATVAAGIALSFHVGVNLLQGLDFMPFWCPVFWVFLPDLQAVLQGLPAAPDQHWTAVLIQGFEEEPCRCMLSAAYLMGQIIVALRFLDLRKGLECLPFTCCPMFAVPRNLFGDEIRGGVLTDLSLRQGGHLDFAYNFYPWCEELPMTEEDLKQIPGRVLMWMSTTHCHPLLSRMMQPEFMGKNLVICANFDVSKSLRARLEELVRVMDEGQPEDWAHAARITEVLDLQELCRAAFEQAPSGVAAGGPSAKLRVLRDARAFGTNGKGESQTPSLLGALGLGAQI